MGAFECKDGSSYHFRSREWEYKNGWAANLDVSAQHSNTYQTCPTSRPGLMTYGYVDHKDYDRYSTNSSDDTCSTAGSVPDSSSVASSQSSQSSAGSEASDDAFEARGVSNNKPSPDSSQTQLGTAKDNEDLAELLTGLRSRTSTNVQADTCSDRLSLSESVPRSVPFSIQPEKCNRRRSGSYDSTNGPPCRLKRDTDSADCFVMLLITFAARLITAIWPLSASPPMMSSCFNGAGVLPLEVFIHETLRRSKTSYSTLQVALFYLILLKDKLSDLDFTKEQPNSEGWQRQSSGTSTCRAMQCGRRMFLAALMLASKYLQDRNYSTRAWSKISGLRIPEINENETEYLRCIDYRLHMKRDAFENWSKIVLTLSKISKLQPGCSLKLDTFQGFGPGADSILAAMAANPTLRHGCQEPAPYSTQWWIDLLKKLDPEIVDDRALTEDFLRNNLPLDDSVTELLARLPNPLPTPSTSPDVSPPHIPDMTFNEALPSGNAPAPRLPTPAEMRAPSPACTSLPLRPQLSNLPTPQSTPRGADPGPWLNISNNRQQSLRCSASADALRAPRKQCMANANLDRCPPPRPQSLARPPVRSLMRPAASTQACYSGSATPVVLSPANSVMTDATSQSSRSRSSSMSSNSSWSSCATGTLQSLQAQIRSQAPSPLSQVASAPEVAPTNPNPTAMPAHALEGKPDFLSEHMPQADRQATSDAVHFHDEGYVSGEDPNAKLASQSSRSEAEMGAAKTLIKMSNGNDKTPTQQHPLGESAPTPRGHKRTISKTNNGEELQKWVSQMVRTASRQDQVMEDSTPTSHRVRLDNLKRWQSPTKVWAGQKKPAPNSMHTKRVALYCTKDYSRDLSAPELASQHIRDEVITALNIPSLVPDNPWSEDDCEISPPTPSDGFCISVVK